MPTLFNVSRLYYPQHGSYTSALTGEGWQVVNFITCDAETYRARYARPVDRARGPYAIADSVTVRNLPLPHDRPVGQRETLNLEHLLGSGFDWGAPPDVLVISQQSGLPPALAGLFEPPPRTILYAEYFEPGDIAARKEWPVHPRNQASNARWRDKSLGDAAAADAIIVPSEFARQAWPEELRAKVHVIFDGVDTRHLAPERLRGLSSYGPRLRAALPGRKLVGHIGRTLESVRGFDSWMKAYVALRQTRSDLHFIILGEDKTIQRGGGSEAFYGIPSFKQWTLDSLGLRPEDMTDVTWIPKLDLYDYLSLVGTLDLVIYPMFGMFGNWSLFQGLLQGVPMVASDRAYLPEVISHGASGFLADPEDIPRLVELSLQILESPDLAERFRQASAATIRDRYSTDQAARQFRALLGRLGVP